jgi:hypothetical protein
VSLPFLVTSLHDGHVEEDDEFEVFGWASSPLSDVAVVLVLGGDEDDSDVSDMAKIGGIATKTQIKLMGMISICTHAARLYNALSSGKD